MGKDVDQVQTQWKTYQLAADIEESYVVFIREDWRSPCMQYLTDGILPQKHIERYKLKRLATHYFLHNRVIFRKGYKRDPLWCLGSKEAREMIKEVHAGECGEHQGKKKLYRCLLQIGYYWSTMKKDTAEFVKKCHNAKYKPTWFTLIRRTYTAWSSHGPSTLRGLIWWGQLTHHRVDTYGSWWLWNTSPNG